MFGLWKWVLNWKGEIMQAYKGLYVPPKVTKAENQAALRETFNRLVSRGDVGACVVAHTSTPLKGESCPLGANCATCICDTRNADQFREFMDEYFGKEENKGEENMAKTYKGVAVPSGVDRNQETLRATMSEGVRGCIFNTTSRNIIGLVGCSDIPCRNCICEHTHRDLLKEYLNKVEKESSMEKRIKAILKPGMVLCTRAGDFSLWVGGPSDEAYRLECTGGCVKITGCGSFEEYDRVDAVYAHSSESSPAVTVSSLVDLMQGRDCPFVHCVWKRPEPAKEMTVDEISKALGYKVKVVGNEKTDD